MGGKSRLRTFAKLQNVESRIRDWANTQEITRRRESLEKPVPECPWIANHLNHSKMSFQNFPHLRPNRSTGLAPLSLLVGAVIIMTFDSAPAESTEASKARKSVEEFNSGESKRLGWRIVNDGVMGGLSKGTASFTEKGIMRFEGTLSLENNGGFSSVRTERMDPLNLSGASGLALRVKGDGRTYQVRLESDARYRGVMAVSFKAEFTTRKGEWTEIEIPFTYFKGSFRGRSLPNETLDPAKIERLGLLLGDKNPGEFNLEIDWLRTFAASGKSGD